MKKERQEQRRWKYRMEGEKGKEKERENVGDWAWRERMKRYCLKEVFHSHRLHDNHVRGDAGLYVSKTERAHFAA